MIAAARLLALGLWPAILLLVLIVGILLGILIALWWLRRHRTPPPPPPPYTIPDTFNEGTLPTALGVRLMGTPADGSRLAPPSSAPSSVIWVDAGDEVLVHVDSMQVRILNQLVLVSVDLETDQTGRTPLVVSFSLGDANDPGGLLASTDDLPRGNGILAARWGRVLQNAVWASLLSLSRAHADERSGAPQAISITAGQLTLHAGTPFQAALLNTRGAS